MGVCKFVKCEDEYMAVGEYCTTCCVDCEAIDFEWTVVTTVVRDTAEAVHVDVEGSITALSNPGPDHDEVIGKSMSRPYLVLCGCKSDVTCVVVGG